MAKRRKKNGDLKKRKYLGIGLIILSVLILLSLVSHSSYDDVRIGNPEYGVFINYENYVGVIGAWSSFYLFWLFGWLSIFIPVFLIYRGLKLLEVEWRSRLTPALWIAFFLTLAITMFSDIYRIDELEASIGYEGAHGGFIFYYMALVFVKLLGKIGSIIFLVGALAACIAALIYSYPEVAERIPIPKRIRPKYILSSMGRGIMGLWDKFIGMFERQEEEYGDFEEDEDEEDVSPIEQYRGATGREEGGEKKKSKKKARRSDPKPKTQLKIKKTKETTVGRETTDYKFPGLDLLDDSPELGPAVSADELSFTARMLKDTLETFGISIEGNIDKYPGPVITRFEFKPAAGVKVNKITNLAEDLALALKAKRIRIVAPIPGKAAVGIEIPNRKTRMVYLKDIISSDQFSDSNIRLPLALGKSISGKPFVTDLATMPHLLVAGATGSGKSVCINTIITSLIYRLHPDDLKFIFIDPKMLELSVYAGIPYLGRPVVTNAKRAEKVLSDAVGEMENRYKKLAGKSVRNIVDYNNKIKDGDEKMPYIVIIVDELADMMMAASSSRIEMLITRLAQMARAVGIHLILATQRPSVDVITGLIKANFSARIAFQVATKIDSRTIIDGNGAEKLLGKGDMLFLQPGQPEPIRLHGAFVSGEETAKITEFIKEQFPDLQKTEEKKGDSDEDDPLEDIDLGDPVLIEAARTVVRHKQGSVSLLQRKLGIGYQRAARLIDDLEKAGVVGPYDGSKARDVLVDMPYIEKMLASRSLTDSNS